MQVNQKKIPNKKNPPLNNRKELFVELAVLFGYVFFFDGGHIDHELRDLQGRANLIYSFFVGTVSVFDTGQSSLSKTSLGGQFFLAQALPFP